MQNKPNLQNDKPRNTTYAIRYTRENEPNFTPNAPTKHAKDTNFTHLFHSLLQLFTRQMRTFANIYLPKAEKLKKMHNFCNFVILTHLTPCTTKTYKTFHPALRSTGHKRRVTIKMRNEPNSSSTSERSLPAVFVAGKYAKRTQFRIYPRLFAHLAQRVTGHGARVTNKYAKRTQFTQLVNLSPCISKGYENELLCGSPEIKAHA
jgi:hypothetical protein